MSEQIEIAVDLGVVPPPLPEIMNLRQLVEQLVRRRGKEGVAPSQSSDDGWLEFMRQIAKAKSIG